MNTQAAISNKMNENLRVFMVFPFFHLESVVSDLISPVKIDAVQ